MRKSKFLLDVNVLIALTEERHVHHEAALRWFEVPGLDWGMCAVSEAGFLRLTANPRIGKVTFREATDILAALTAHPGYRFWPISDSWTTLAEPFRERLFGHQQITDALMLGLAVKENGVLVTLDKGIRFLASPDHSHNVVVLE